MRMHSRRAWALVTVGLLGLVTACGDGDDGTGPDGLTIADLAGTWEASSFVYSQAGTGAAVPDVDLVADGGSATLLLQSDGSFVLTIVDDGGTPDIAAGTMAFDGEDFLIVSIGPDEIDFFFELLGDDAFRLTDNVGQAEFDLDGDGTDEPVRLAIRFERV